MCGVFAACDLDASLSAEFAWQAVERMHHRGPDERHAWCNPQRTACQGHARLSLVGLANGSQPIGNESRTIYAVINGEFYGHLHIREELVSRGHRFSTDSDSEILVHLYEEHGVDCLRYLRGEFAFVLWDQQRETMIAARDRFGVKPLVYALEGERLLIASEARALLPERKPAWDADAFFFASSMQYLPPERTLFQGIRQVPPGGLLTFDRQGLRQASYWELDFPLPAERSTGDLPEAIQEVRTRLTDAVQVRLQADVPVCFHLSGGLDSSAVLGIASRVTGQKQHAFTLCFDDAGYDESELAQQTANYCEAEWHRVPVTRHDVLHYLEDAVIGSEGLAINGHLTAKYLLNRAIHQAGFKAVLSGEGADELFAGYAHLRMDWWRSQQFSFDSQQLAHSNASQVGMMLPSGEGLSLAAVNEALGYEPAFLQAKATLGYRLRSLLDNHWQDAWSRRDAFAEMLNTTQAQQQLKGRSPLKQSTWLWTRLALAGYIFRTLGDGTEMPWSVEGRVPFVDHQLFEHVRTLPDDFLIRDTTEKYVLREAVRPFVTPAIYARQKHPLDAPPLLTRDTVLLDTIRQKVQSSEFRQQPFFDWGKVVSLLDEIPRMSAAQRQAWDPVLMMMLSTIAIQKLMNSCPRNLQMTPENATSEQWWVDFHVAEMADLFLEREDKNELPTTIDYLVNQLGLTPSNRVFDQCCGIGNLSHGLARRGMQCVGVDLCGLYIERAKAGAEDAGLDCEFYCDDAFTFVPSNVCDGAFNWYSSFGYAAKDDRNSLMAARALEALRPGGVYALDVPNFPFVLRNFQRYMVRHGTNRKGRQVTCIRESQLDLRLGLLRQTWRWMIEDRPIDERHSALRIYLPHQLVDMLEGVGFTDVRMFGNLENAELTMNSPRLILTARKPDQQFLLWMGPE